jgi:NAD(P)-dependent dehydrogenase (short-subunit alcohol dehydrogenase family)
MRNVVVTGSASGLGAAIARRLEKDGQRVIGVDRRDALIVADLGTPEGRRSAVEDALAACENRIDGVVSCAGLGPYDEPVPITRVNYFGAIAILDGLKPALAAGVQPAAVGISSVGGAFEALAIPEYIEACQAGDEERAASLIEDRDGNTSYCNAKRALAIAIRRRAAEWGALGVRLNAVLPGKTETPMLDALLAHEDHAPAVNALPVPLGRSAPADEVAGAVAFLLGPDSSYVHGHLLFADGGSDAFVRPDTV